MSLPYDKSLINRAKALRKGMTPQEKKLWYQFLAKYPVRFQRQKAIGHYIADFFCANAKLIIEADGGGHFTEEQQRYDEKRSEVLQCLGLLVLRFTNIEITTNFEGVCYMIDKTVKERTSVYL